MNKLFFCFRAIRNNIRTAPLAFVALVWSIAIAFVFEAWTLRSGFVNEIGETNWMTILLTVGICFILFLFLLFMYNYWLKITKERNIPYERMGAPRYVLFAESLLELLIIVALGSVIGYMFDSIIFAIAPRPKYIRYLDAILFFKTVGFVLIAPTVVLLGKSFYSVITRIYCTRRQIKKRR